MKHGHANKLRQVVEDHLQISIDSMDNKGYQSSTATLIRNEDFEISRPNTLVFTNIYYIDFIDHFDLLYRLIISIAMISEISNIDGLR